MRLADAILTKAEQKKLLARPCLVPQDVSWRKVDKIKSLGWATLDPFHRRWQGCVVLTDAGRAALAGL